MAGLRALCCSKGDQGDDDQHTLPNRPAHRRSEKETQNAPGDIETPISSTDVTQDKPAPRDLWKEAYDNLDPGRKEYVATDGTSATDAINSVIEVTTAKYKQWKKGGLRIRRKTGGDIDLRDSAEKILNAAMKAKDVISKFAYFDPTGHGRCWRLPPVR